MKTKSLHFKWTVSRGRESYGYNICTLFVDGDKKGCCNGGGYDMTGTSFAYWIQNDYQEELKKLFADELAKVSEMPQVEALNWEGKPYKPQYAWISCRDKFYGATANKNHKTGGLSISLDGACGFDSIRKIAQAIGIELKWNPESDKSRNHDYYTAIINDPIN